MNFPNLMREMSNLTSLFLELDGGGEEGEGEEFLFSDYRSGCFTSVMGKPKVSTLKNLIFPKSLTRIP